MPKNAIDATFGGKADVLQRACLLLTQSGHRLDVAEFGPKTIATAGLLPSSLAPGAKGQTLTDRRTHGLTGIFRDLTVTKVFCAERFLFAARGWIGCTVTGSGRHVRPQLNGVQIFNDRARLCLGIPQTSQFAL